MKNKKLIWIIGAIVAVVVAAVVLIICLVGEKENEDAKMENLYQGIGEIVSIKYEYGADSVELIKKKGKWQWKDDKTLEVDQETVEYAVERFENLPVIDFFEGPDGLETYGLKKPTYSITMKDAKGVKKTILIGDSSGEDGMTWYAMEKGEDMVYIVTYDVIDLIDSLDLQRSMAIQQQEMYGALEEEE